MNDLTEVLYGKFVVPEVSQVRVHFMDKEDMVKYVRSQKAPKPKKVITDTAPKLNNRDTNRNRLLALGELTREHVFNKLGQMQQGTLDQISTELKMSRSNTEGHLKALSGTGRVTRIKAPLPKGGYCFQYKIAA